MKKEPKDDFNACQDFFTLIVHSHILCVAMDMLNMDTLSSVPVSEVLSADAWKKSKAEKEKMMLKNAQFVIARIVDLSPCKNTDTNKDHVFEYGCEIVSLGLLFLNYRDAIQEGDGERIMLCWKYFVLLFKATNRRNYAIEAFHTLANRKMLPPRLAHQLVWSRFVNTHKNNKPGYNIPCDLYIEHVNRMLKDYIHHLHANKTESAICRVSQSMGPVNNIMKNFDQTNFLCRSDFHTASSSANDQDIVIKEIREAKVFEHRQGRSHHSFPKFCCNPLNKLNYTDLVDWLKEHAKNIDCSLEVPNSSMPKE